MTFRSLIVCDGCDRSKEADPDDGAPVGWYLLARMTKPGGCWDDGGEWHFCSPECVRAAVPPDLGPRCRCGAPCEASTRDGICECGDDCDF